MPSKLVLVLLVAGAVGVGAAATARGIGSREVAKPAAQPGELKSPNGLFSIRVADDGITLNGPAGKIQWGPSGILISSNGSLTLRATGNVNVQSSQDVGLRAGGTVDLTGQAKVSLNGCAQPVARKGDGVVVTAQGASGSIAAGSPSVCAG